MRDPNRIDAYCARLAAIWKRVPDWRFGQLVSNLFGEYYMRTKKDLFFPEDEELFRELEACMDAISSPYENAK